MKIIAVGSRDFVAGLRLAGVNEGFIVSNYQDADEKLSALIKRGDVALILVEESYAFEIPRFYDKYLKLKQPIIAVIPTGKAKEGVLDYMSELIKRTIGVEVVIK
ncbi:MAG: V-type ATP synthase subunit F [Candidatus Nezhaarchaeota archaeon]|nr:V-type ATP synthase subunit F [Candidatus Nezhaarchaeota archaeon]